MTPSAFSELFQSPLAGRYAIQQTLGTQVGRQTFLAYDLQNQTQVVLKLLLLGRNFQWQDLKLFEREAKTLQSLCHPAIPRYLDYLDINLPRCKGVALVQSYVTGRSLEAHLQAGRTFSEADVKKLAKDLLEILSYLHQQSPPVIHRDIKPSNILLTDSADHRLGQVYLVDFGSVQHLAAQAGSTITVVGTYGYMPPEQFGGRTMPASDLYSLGATLIYLVTGQHPTELTQSDFRIQFQHPSLSPAFADWLKWLTKPNVDDRPASATATLQVLENPSARSERVAIRQPKQSQIILKKTPKSLEVTIPPNDLFGWDSIAILCIITPVVVRVANHLSLAAYNAPTGQGLYRYLEAGSASTLMIVLITTLSYALFSKCQSARVHLCIDQKQVSLVQKSLFSRGRRKYLASRQSVKRILTCSYFRMHEVVIQAGSKKHRVGKGLLTKAEAQWLAHELNNWLNVP